MLDLQIEQIPIDKVKKWAGNPRIIDKIEFHALKESLREFGLVEPLIYNKKSDRLISGHQRYQAATELGYKTVPIVFLDVDEKTEKKLNVLLNSPKLSGRYDELKLAELLEEFKLDENYSLLRLNELEPLDLSPTNREEDKVENAFTTTPEDWANASIKKVELYFSNEEFPYILELMSLAQEVAEVDNNTEAVKAALEAYVN